MTDHDAPRDQDDGCDDSDTDDPTLRKLESLFKRLRGSDEPAPGDSNSVSQRFRLIRRHASGGLGEIWIAHDEELNRDVALKLIQPQHSWHEQSRSRFLREATITSQLEHPGIVPIYALGHHENGQPFYAMRFVQGDTLHEAITRFHAQAPNSPERNLEWRKLVTRLIDVCNAVAYAHSRGVVHRDLKPNNIMVGEFGETLVVDWGLAKRFRDSDAETPESNSTAHVVATSENGLRDSSGNDESTAKPDRPTPTQMGSTIGSPPYMSPEQAAGRIDKLSPATDIYSLGATLFEILTGQSPIGATPKSDRRPKLSVARILKRVRGGRFPRPSTIVLDVPLPLEAVCLKAMSLRPKDRYASARGLAADLEAWLADEPVTAWTEPLTIRVRRWMRRHQTAVTSTATAALVAFVTLSLLVIVVNERSERLATANRQVNFAAEKALQWADDTSAVVQFFQEKVLAAARPENEAGGLGVDATIRAAVDAAEPQVGITFQDRPFVEAAIRNTLGVTYSYLGETELAIQQHERSRQLNSEHLGPDHPNTLASMNNLASAYDDAGQTLLAISLHKQTLEKLKTKFVADDPVTLLSMHNLAMAYQTSKQFDLAIPLYEQTLEKKTLMLGPSHPQTLITMSNLADTYHAAGRIDEALRLHEATLKRRKIQLGEDALDTLTSMNNLACVYTSKGKFDLGIELHEETIAKMEKKLGQDHPLTLRSLHNLAHDYRQAGEPNLAQPLYELTLKKRTAKLGPRHFDTIATMRGLARTYRDSAKHELALSLYKKTLELMKQTSGLDHPDTLNLMSDMAQAYYKANQLDEAQALYQETLKRQTAILGSDDVDTIASMRGLALAYRDAGMFDRALPLYENALELIEKQFDDGDPTTLSARFNLGYAYHRAGKPEKAEPQLRTAMTGYRDKFGLSATETQTAVAALIDFYTETKQHEKAELLLAEFVKFLKGKGGAKSPVYVVMLAALGQNLLEQRKFYDSESLIRECLVMSEKSRPDHWTTFKYKSLLGGSLLGQKKYADAEPLLLSGYDGMKKRESAIPAHEKISLGEAIQRLTDFYDATSQNDKATTWRAKFAESQKP